MEAIAIPERQWTADEFMVTDQRAFGDAWRYELVEGRIVAHAAPAPDHGAIIAGIIAGLARRLPSRCRPEAGSAAAPKTKQRNTARIPDVIVRCGELPTIAFEIVSPSEIRDWRGRDLKRRHVQAVEGIREIVEIYQDDYAAHVYRARPDGTWLFESLGGAGDVLRLGSIGVAVPLPEIYAFVALPRGPASEAPSA